MPALVVLDIVYFWPCGGLKITPKGDILYQILFVHQTLTWLCIGCHASTIGFVILKYTSISMGKKIILVQYNLNITTPKYVLCVLE